MLDGWYCRSIASMQANSSADNGEGVSSNHEVPPVPQRGEPNDSFTSEGSSRDTPEPNYKAQYNALKGKLKYLIYENECFQDALRSSQKRMLKVSRDRCYLMDRLLEYEKVDSSEEESQDTESSDDQDAHRQQVVHKRSKASAANPSSGVDTKAGHAPKRRRAPVSKKAQMLQNAAVAASRLHLAASLGHPSDGHMTPEEVERHLTSRQSLVERLPERAPPTVPTEMFSNEPSLDSESNDVLEQSPGVEWFD